MKHLDTHTLELYALGSEAIARENENIKKHLDECFGCRSFVEQMEGIYQNAEKLMDNAEAAGEFMTNKITIKQSKIKETNDLYAEPFLFVTKTRAQKVIRFVRSYPVQSGVGMLGIAAGLAFLLSSVLKGPAKDLNPTECRYNSVSNSLQVINSKSEELASFMLGDNPFFDRSKAQCNDLNGDGLNEIVTTLTLAEDMPGKPTYLRIFGANKQLLNKKQFVAPFKYLDRTYGSFFRPTDFIVTSFEHNKKEMIVKVQNVGNSPSFIARLDNETNDIGRFWHFGYFISQSMMDLFNNGRQELILMGENDVQDDAHGEYPVIAVIDPTKIVGDKKSTASAGFAWNTSDAEIYYIRLAIPDVDTALKRIPAVREGHLVSPETICFASGIGEDDNPGFDYYFNKKMEAVEVKVNQRTEIFRRKLVEQGKLKGIIDKTYLESLKNGVRYWDGKEWQKEVVKVNPSL